MIKIAICDNDRAELDKAHRAVSAFLDSERVDFDIAVFKDPFELSSILRDGNCFDIMILDTSTREISGIELAEDIRENDLSCEIIFLSQTPDRAYDAYRVNAIQYILKPYHQSKINSALKRALTQIRNSSPGYSVLKTSDGIRRVGWDEIINSSTVGHYQLISLTDGTDLKLRATSNELYSMLEDSGYFMRVGSPYIINITHLKELQAHELTLDNGARIPLPKNSYKLIKNEFFEMEKNLKRR